MSVASLARASKPVSLGDRIADLDLGAPLRRFVAATGASPRAADLAEQHYRAFLAIKSRHPTSVLAPSRTVDRLWHAHVVNDVAGYLADCQFVAGRLLNHRTLDRPDPDAFTRMKVLLAVECSVDLADVAGDADPLIAGLAEPGACV